MRTVWLLVLPLLLGGPTLAIAAEDEVPPVKVMPLFEGLDNPCGVAVQPGTGNVFISEGGAGRVMRITSSGHHEVAISDFPKGTLDKEPTNEDGPLGLAFLGRDELVVGGGGLHAGKDLIRFFEIPPPGKTLKADKAKYRVGPWPANAASASGEGDFYGVIADGVGSVYFTSHGGGGKGWVSRIAVAAGKPGPILPLVKTRTADGIGGRVGITLSPRGEVVVSQTEDVKKAHSCLLTFYDPVAKKLLLKLDTGLNDIAGLAYSPRTGWLYAVDFSRSDPKQGGLYRLDKTLVDDRQGVKAVLVTPLDKPTALVFAPNGALYVTIFGTAKKDGKEKPGALMRITGKL